MSISLKFKNVFVLAVLQALLVSNVCAYMSDFDSCNEGIDSYYKSNLSFCHKIASMNMLESDTDICASCLLGDGYEKDDNNALWDFGKTAFVATANVLSNVLPTALNAKFQRDSVFRLAESADLKTTTCSNDLNSFYVQNTARGANPVLFDQLGGYQRACGGFNTGGSSFAGFNGLQSNTFGGFANANIAAGYTPDYLAGMMGPFYQGGQNTNFNANVRLDGAAGLAAALGLGVLGGRLPGAGINLRAQLGNGNGLAGLLNYPGNIGLNGQIGAGNNSNIMCFTSPCSNSFSGNTNLGLNMLGNNYRNPNAMFNASLGLGNLANNGSYFNNTNGFGNNLNLNNNAYLQYQSQYATQRAILNQNAASYARAQGNIGANSMADRGLYRNYMDAANNLRSSGSFSALGQNSYSPLNVAGSFNLNAGGQMLW